MSTTRQEAAMNIATFNKATKLIAGAISLGEEDLIEEAVDCDIDFKNLADNIADYIIDDPDPKLYDQLIHLTDTTLFRKHIAQYPSANYSIQLKVVMEQIERLVEYGRRVHQARNDSHPGLIDFFANDRAEELFNRAVKANILTEQYMPNKGLQRYQIKVTALCIADALGLKTRNKWCHFDEQWGTKHIATWPIPETKGVGILRVARLYPEVDIWKLIGGKEIQPNVKRKSTLETTMSKSQACALLKGLIMAGYIDPRTEEENFLGIMGLVKIPPTPINWTGQSLRSLVYFMKTLFSDMNRDVLRQASVRFTYHGNRINHETLKSQSSILNRHLTDDGFIPEIDEIIASSSHSR